MSPANAPAHRARLLGATLLVAVFVGGAFGGAAVDRVVRVRPVATQSTPGAERDNDRRERRTYVFEQLDLTPTQRVGIDNALEQRRAQMDAFWVDARPRLRAIVDSTREDIRAVLTPEQRAEYDRLLAERDARRKEHDRDREEDDRP